MAKLGFLQQMAQFFAYNNRNVIDVAGKVSNQYYYQAGRPGSGKFKKNLRKQLSTNRRKRMKTSAR